MSNNNDNVRQIQLEQLRLLQEAGRMPKYSTSKEEPAKPKTIDKKPKQEKVVKAHKIEKKNNHKVNQVQKKKDVKEVKPQTINNKPKQTKVVKVHAIEKKKQLPKEKIVKEVKQQPQTTNSEELRLLRNKLKFYANAGVILAIMGISGYVLYKTGLPQDIINHYKVKSSYEKVLEEPTEASEIIQIPVIEETESEVIEEEPVEYISAELFNEGYEFNSSITPEKLKEINPVLSRSTAWIEIPGTKINYPFVVPGLSNIDQVEGLREKINNSGMSEAEYMNNYFLHVDINGTYSDWGCPYQSIYTQDLNQHTSDLSDVSVIYAHHMSDGSMFSGLDKWKKDRDGSYNSEHPYGVIYTDDGMCYKLTFITSGIINGSDGYSMKIGDFDSIEDKQQFVDDFIEMAKRQGCYTMDSYTVDENTKFMALSTCSYGNIYNNPRNNDRYVLIGVLEKQIIKDVHIDGYEIGKEKER